MSTRRKITPAEVWLQPDMYSSPEECYARNAPINTYHPWDPAPRPRMGPVLRKALGLPPEDQHE